MKNLMKMVMIIITAYVMYMAYIDPSVAPMTSAIILAIWTPVGLIAAINEEV